MKIVYSLLIILLTGLFTHAQRPDDLLASTNGRNFTAQDLAKPVAEAWLGLKARLAETRVSLLERQIEQNLFEIEAGMRGVSVDEFMDAELAKNVKGPTAEEIRAVYDQNKKDLAGTPLEAVRERIRIFILRNKERELYEKLVGGLREKYKVVKGKDVNAPTLEAHETVAMINGRPIKYSDYLRTNGLRLYEFEASVYDQVKNALTQLVDAAVYSAEARSEGLPTNEFLAREITNKMSAFTERERAGLENALKKRVYAKYRVRFFIKEPKPFIQKISADDDPSYGAANAPVTVVMFTDYQCPACAAVHPVLKSVVAEFGKQVRLVIRDFPLEKVHDNAFNAALAANAAYRQGKLPEYSELLYNNQDSLDAESLKLFASRAGLNPGRFARDLGSKENAREIRNDVKDGKSYGVSGTPSVFVNGYKIRVLAESRFRRAIERAIAREF